MKTESNTIEISPTTPTVVVSLRPGIVPQIQFRMGGLDINPNLAALLNKALTRLVHDITKHRSVSPETSLVLSVCLGDELAESIAMDVFNLLHK